MKKTFLLFFVLLCATSFSQNLEKQEDNNIYNLAGIDVKPAYPDGLKQLNAYVNENYKKAGFESERKGKIYTLFVVEKDGSLSDIKLLRGLDLEKSKVIIQILKSCPKWKPGQQNGRLVRVLYTLPLELGS
jgi:protein TonB